MFIQEICITVNFFSSQLIPEDVSTFFSMYYIKNVNKEKQSTDEVQYT